MPKLRAGIHFVDGEGKPELRCGFEWDGGDVKIIVGEDTPIAKGILKNGIESCNFKTYKVGDGEAFMRALPLAFRGAMAYADLWEEKDGQWVEAEPSVDVDGESGGMFDA